MLAICCVVGVALALAAILFPTPWFIVFLLAVSQPRCSRIGRPRVTDIFTASAIIPRRANERHVDDPHDDRPLTYFRRRAHDGLETNHWGQYARNTVLFPIGGGKESMRFHPPRQRRLALLCQTPDCYDSRHSQPLGLSIQAQPHARLQGQRTPGIRRGASASIAVIPQITPRPRSFASSCNSLETTLYEGSSSLQTATLSFLVVACGHQDPDEPIEDPALDASYLQDALGDSTEISFVSLLGNDATLAKIKENITSLWNQAALGTYLLLLLTGHGNNNTMELSSGETIDESYLNSLFQSLPKRDLHVIIVFDICRNNKDKAAIMMDKRIALVWSCSPGQRAYALKFGSFRMPSSFFLIGIFMASWDVSCNPANGFEHHLGERIRQLAKFNNHIEHRNICDLCLANQPCPEKFEMRKEFEQDIDLEQAQGSLSALHALLMRHPRFTRLSEDVANFMLNNNPFLKSNDLLLPNRPLRGVKCAISQAPLAAAA